MEQYSLFLDEIYTGGHFKHFCLAGVIIKTDVYTNVIIPEVENIKRNFFNGNTSVVLHAQKIQDRKDNTPFSVFQDPKLRDEFWDRSSKLLSQNDIRGLAVAVNEEQLKTMYPRVRNIYFPALQVIVENFVHFLESVNGFGTISIESTNPSPEQFDDQLSQHFHHLKANGTLFYNQRIIQSRLGQISFPLKEDNIIGLQLADLIPNTLNRQLSGHKLRTNGLMDVFESIAYDGFCNQKDRFGIKVIP